MSTESESAISRRKFVLGGTAAAAVAALRGTGAQPAGLPGMVDSVWEPVSERRIRIGVVGGGFGASFHWHEDPNCTVHAVSDLIPQRREILRQRYHCDKAYDSMEELVLDPEIEAVAVFTEATNHARHVILCMEHGKHVISAVPACMTLEEAHAMKEVKERTGLTYMMAETSYYRPESMVARRLYRDGAFGNLIYTEAEYYHPMLPDTHERANLFFRNRERTWRYGLPPMLYPTHSTAFLVGVSGERLTRVSCIGFRPSNDEVFAENAYGNPFNSGFGMFLTDRGNAFRCNVAWGIWGHGERAQWFGSDGALFCPGWAGQPYGFRQPDHVETTLPDFRHALPPDMRYDSGHGGSHPFLTHEFIDALVEERPPAVDLYEALAYTVPGIVGHESCFRDGEQLPIPSFDPA
jgi:predicted dehydrogenase